MATTPRKPAKKSAKKPAQESAQESGEKPTEAVDQRILEATLAMADAEGWSSVRLRRVAERLELPLSEVLTHYRDLDAVADAWFRRALAAMLSTPPDEIAALPARERLHLVLMRWFDCLAPYKRVTGEMLSGKLHLPHAHHWVPMIFNLSRTIHWLRDTAMLDAGGRRREIEEIGLTGLFLATLAVWLRDDSEGQARTRAFLARGLGLADDILARCNQRRPRAA